MVYYTVADAVDYYLAKFDLRTAIVKSQRAKHQSKTEYKYNFWVAVENELKTRLPQKIPNYLRNKE